MTTCAVVQFSDNVVINAIVAEPSDLAPDGCYLVEYGPDTMVYIGGTYVDGVFVAPAEEPIPEPAPSD